MSDPRRAGAPPTIAIYDRPPWWRRRRTWALAASVLASLAALVALFVWFA
ncbi:MAG: hypothetical protein KJ018_13450 [Burkholderiales bacterium]|nr:hypothetical protein [Burkholderiales bacterium]GIK88092.1 MAG: hypothetical protein BroJett026_35730 [Betaproteobacteria bacterium]